MVLVVVLRVKNDFHYAKTRGSKTLLKSIHDSSEFNIIRIGDVPLINYRVLNRYL